jgi:hypothetical protein
MLAQNNPEAFQELLRLLADKMVDEAIREPQQTVDRAQSKIEEPACAH